MRRDLCVVAIIIILQGLIVGVIFRPVPYPCTESGIGCNSIWEMLHDTWNVWYAVLCSVLGMMLLTRAFNENKKKNGD